jgi:hypothetical protein
MPSVKDTNINHPDALEKETVQEGEVFSEKYNWEQKLVYANITKLLEEKLKKSNEKKLIEKSKPKPKRKKKGKGEDGEQKEEDDNEKLFSECRDSEKYFEMVSHQIPISDLYKLE